MTTHASNRTRFLAASAALGSVGLAAGGSASPLLAAEMTHGVAASGLPLGVVVAGSALSAVVISARTGRAGRVSSLCLGYAVGALGACVVVGGSAADSFAIVLTGSFLLGAANAAVFLTRYAAAELAPPAARGRAVGTVLFATTAGAVLAPNLLVPSARIATAVDLPRLCGLFLLAAPAFAAAAVLLATRAGRETRAAAVVPTPRRLSWSPETRTGLVVLATANIVMVAIMAIAPVHMVEHGRSLAFVGLVVSVHVAAMFAPSALTGRLADRVGPLTVAAAGLSLQLAAAVAGGFAAFASTATVLGFLIAVGLGWNAAVIGGSMLLVASVPSEQRPHTEGVGEVAMGLAAAAGAPGAGLLVALGGFLALGLGAALVAIAGLGLIALRPPPPPLTAGL